MEQFSHDLTLALEETSKNNARISSRWGLRRRTRSTGNLPCAPQPTEDSSSSPADQPNKLTTSNGVHNISDSDDRHDIQLSLKARKALIGNFESDSFNENFSPARPNTRRKRKFKRMAVEYETTPSTPNIATGQQIFPITGTVKKRVLKHGGGQENYKTANLAFCGKRKRSHRFDYDKQHSSSVPRQRDVFTPKTSYLEYKNRTRNFVKQPCERILPLNKSIVSKIEKISQDTKFKLGYELNSMIDDDTSSSIIIKPNVITAAPIIVPPTTVHKTEEKNILRTQQQDQNQRVTHKSGSFESTFNFQNYGAHTLRTADEKTKDGRKSKSGRRHDLIQLQFDDPCFMDCGASGGFSGGGPNEFSSSSSLSSDSEEIETNESDREGDDELTDWPGNEAMINFASKHDFKKAKPKLKSTLTQIKSDELIQDDDTLMSGDDIISPVVVIGTPILPGFLPATTSTTLNQPPTSLNLINKNSPATTSDNKHLTMITMNNKLRSSLPIDIAINNSKQHEQYKQQIESEMSGETSNHFYSSPNTVEIREIRAGCRRIRDERPGFSIISSANADLAKFLQDGRQTQLRLSDVQDIDKLAHLANLYSLSLDIIDGFTILTKTSNTTQSVHVEQTKLNKPFLSDYKRRCYGDDDVTESNEMAS